MISFGTHKPFECFQNLQLRCSKLVDLTLKHVSQSPEETWWNSDCLFPSPVIVIHWIWVWFEEFSLKLPGGAKVSGPMVHTWRTTILNRINFYVSRMIPALYHLWENCENSHLAVCSMIKSFKCFETLKSCLTGLQNCFLLRHALHYHLKACINYFFYKLY